MVKAVPEKWKTEENWMLFENLVRSHKDDDIDVFISPECFLDGYAVTEEDWTKSRFEEIAQDIDESFYIEQLKKLADELNAYTVFGLTEKVKDNFYNCALLVGRNGKIEGKYYKTHLQNHDLRFSAGMDLPVFELDFGVVGMVICADRRWPETIRTLRLKGAEVILMPTYGMWHLDNEWWMRTRAYENEMFVCFAHPQVSLITEPKGKVAAKLQSNFPDVLVHDINLDETKANMLRDRRPEIYGIISETS